MSVTRYSSTDSSAPTICKTAGSIITFFDSVLVTGYGTKSSCGWTKVTGNGSTLAVYKAPTAMGNFYMFARDDITANHGATAYWLAGVRFMWGGTVTGINSGTGTKWPFGIDFGNSMILTETNNWQAICKTTTSLATSTNVRWDLINHDTRGFYLWIDQFNETATAKPTNATFYAIVRPKMLFGITDTAVLTMFRNTAVGSPNWTPWDLTFSQNMSNMDTRYHHKNLFNYRNNNTGIVVDYMQGIRSITNSEYLGNAGSNYAAYPSLDGNMHVTDVHLFTPQDEYGIPVCKLPGVLVPLHARPLDHYSTIAGSAPYASSNYIAWCAHQGQVLIDLTDNW